MSYIQRNQSDLPLTSGETSEFLPEEQEQDELEHERRQQHLHRNSIGKKRDKSGNLARDRLGSGTGSMGPAREQWGSKFEFIFSCMAFSVGLGNVSTSATTFLFSLSIVPCFATLPTSAH